MRISSRASELHPWGFPSTIYMFCSCINSRNPRRHRKPLLIIYIYIYVYIYICIHMYIYIQYIHIQLYTSDDVHNIKATSPCFHRCKPYKSPLHQNDLSPHCLHQASPGACGSWSSARHSNSIGNV